VVVVMKEKQIRKTARKGLVAWLAVWLAAVQGLTAKL
jgi:hypothetical protein